MLSEKYNREEWSFSRSLDIKRNNLLEITPTYTEQTILWNKSMENLIDEVEHYFELFSRKDLEGVSRKFSDDIFVQDWDIYAQGKEKVIEVNKGIFEVNEQIISRVIQKEINDTREKELIRCKSSDNIIIGEVSLFSKDNKRTATVKALTNCQIGYLDKKDFFKICQEDKDAGYKVINNLTKIITQKLIDTNHQVLKLTTAFSLIIDN